MSSVRFIGGRSVLGESPIWDPRLDALFWVDINSRLVHRWDWSSGEESTRPTGGRPGSIALTKHPGVLVVAMEHALHLLDWQTGATTLQCDLPIAEVSIRLNDGRVDRSGNFWVGSMHVPATDERSVGSLFCVQPDWSAREVLTGLGVANGLAFPVGDSIMYFADTARRTVWRYAVDLEGRLSDRITFVDFDVMDLPGKPDGGCVDSEGGYWIACVHGSAIARIAADGRLDRVLTVPFRRPTCLAFGGPDLATLFVTSIGGGDYYPVFDDEPDAGRVLALDVGMTGVAEGVFASNSSG